MAERVLSVVMPDDTDYKIVLLGEVGVGKTTFFLRIKVGDYVDTSTVTTSVEYQPFLVSVGSGDDCPAVKVLQFN